MLLKDHSKVGHTFNHKILLKCQVEIFKENPYARILCCHRVHGDNHDDSQDVIFVLNRELYLKHPKLLKCHKSAGILTTFISFLQKVGGSQCVYAVTCGNCHL